MRIVVQRKVNNNNNNGNNNNNNIANNGNVNNIGNNQHIIPNNNINPIPTTTTTTTTTTPVNNNNNNNVNINNIQQQQQQQQLQQQQQQLQQHKKKKKENNNNIRSSSSGNNRELRNPSPPRPNNHSDEENSADEYEPPKPKSRHNINSSGSSISNIQFDEKQFEEILKKKGLYIRKMKQDGNCLFRSIADQIYGDQEMQNIVREKCMDYIEKERDHFSQFITEDIHEYIRRKRNDRVYGNNTEMQAMAELFNRPIEVYHKGLDPINIFHSSYRGNHPIRLSYHHGNHYDSIYDINNPSIGVGLGFADFQPGLADKSQLDKAMKKSDIDFINKQLFQDSILTSDWRETEKEIEEAVLAASRAEFIESFIKNLNNNNGDDNFNSNNNPNNNNYNYYNLNNNNNNNNNSGSNNNNNPPNYNYYSKK